MDTSLLQEIEALHPGVVQAVVQARVARAQQAVAEAEQHLQAQQAVLAQHQTELNALQVEQPSTEAVAG